MYACEKMLHMIKVRIKDKENTYICINVNLRNISVGVLVEHKIGDACVKL